MLILFSSGIYAQSGRLALLEDGRYAIHRVDFEKGVALRMLLDTLYFEKQLENKVMAVTLSAKDKEINTLKAERDKLYESNQMLQTNLMAEKENLIACNEKASKNRSWATLGRVYTGVICVGVLTAGTVAILNAVR